MTRPYVMIDRDSWRPYFNPVFFCGDYLAGPGTGAALFTGWECADRLLTTV